MEDQFNRKRNAKRILRPNDQCRTGIWRTGMADAFLFLAVRIWQPLPVSGETHPGCRTSFEERETMVSTFHGPRFVLRTPQFVAFTKSGQAPRADNAEPSQDARHSTIPISVWDDSEHVHIEADLPGLHPQHVDVRIEDDALKISAERTAPERAGQKQHDERAFGHFYRALGLGKHIERSRVDAQLRDGVLSITLHKRPEAQTQKVNVRYASPEPSADSAPPATQSQS